MKNTLTLLLITLFMGTWLNAQVKIGDNPQNIDPSSVLELESTDKVLVITRVTTIQMNAIVPSQGALCYNTDLQAVHFYDGTQWVNIGSSGTDGPLTADPIVNNVSTIVITPTATGDNLEVAPNSISSEQIIDGGVNGVDIQDGSIGPGKLQNNSVTEEKLSENSVGAFALDNDNIGVSAFNNDVGYITAGDLNSSVSGDTPNSITVGSDGGAYYDDTNLMNDVLDNTMAIAMDDDQSSANEIQNPELNGTLLGLTLTGGTVDLGPLISAGGSDDQNIGPISINPGNILSIGIENGLAGTVDLSSLAGGGGSTEVVDGTTLTGVGTVGDPFKIEPGASGQVLTTVGADVVWATVTPGGGTTEVVDNATLTGVGTAGDPFKIEPAATFGRFLRTDPITGNVLWADLPTGSGGTVATDNQTILGNGLVGSELEVPANGITSLQIANATILGEDLNQMTATDGQVLTWDNTLANWIPADSGGGGTQNLDQVLTVGNDAGAAQINNIADPTLAQDAATKAYVDAAVTAGGLLTNGTILIGDALNTPQQLAIFGDATLSNTAEITIENDAITTIKILDANVTTAKIAPATPLSPAADQMLITNGTTDLVEWAPLASHLGTQNYVFFADTDGTPTTTEDNTFANDDGDFFWDPIGRKLDATGTNDFGALYIGLQNAVPTTDAKVHIADNFPGVAFALKLQNTSATQTGRTTGILFSTELLGDYGKGALVYEYQNSFARGDFHFLQNSILDTSIPALTDRAFTVRNNKDIVLYGGIDIDGLGLGAANEVLTSTGTGVQWAAGGGSTTVVSANTPNSIVAGTDGGALYDDTTIAAAVAANTAANTADTDQDPNNEIELPTGGSNGQVLSLDASLNPVWSTGAGTLNNLATDNQVQDAEDRTYDLNNQNLVFTGLGNIGIGNTANPPSNKLHVAGAIRAEGIRNSAGTPTSVAYSFNLDPNTGINNTGADELTFLVGALPAMIISDEGTTDSEIVLNGSLELTEQLLDATGLPGTAGQILSSTATGTQWSTIPTVIAMGKIGDNGAVINATAGVTTSGVGGIYFVTLNASLGLTDGDYIINATILSPSTVPKSIIISNQTQTGFTVNIVDSVGSIGSAFFFTVTDL